MKLHFKAPHDYFEYAPRYESYLADIAMPEPLSLWDRGEGSIATRGVNNELERVIGTSIGRRNFRRSYDADWEVEENVSDAEAKRIAYNIYLKKYFRCVKGVDDNLGRLFSYLEKKGSWITQLLCILEIKVFSLENMICRTRDGHMSHPYVCR